MNKILKLKIVIDIHCLAKKSLHFDLNQQIVVLKPGVASVGQV